MSDDKTNAFSSEQNHLLIVLPAIISLISLLFSVISVYLIVAMKKWNGFLILVMSLSATQIPLSLGHIFALANLNFPGSSFQICQTEGFLLYYAGLSSGFWTNLISFSFFYIIVRSKSLQIKKYYLRCFLFAVGLPIGLSIAMFANNSRLNKGIECYLPIPFNETASIIYFILHECSFYGNCLLCFLAIALVQRTRFILNHNFAEEVDEYAGGSSQKNRISILVGVANLRASIFSVANSNSTMGTVSKRNSDAVTTLAYRMIGYPVIQLICEIFRSWDMNNFKYGQQNKDPNFVAHMLHLCTGAARGFLYFLLFLCMQPNAMKYFFNVCLGGYCVTMTAKFEIRSQSPLKVLSSTKDLVSQDRVGFLPVLEMDEDELIQVIESKELFSRAREPSMFSDNGAKGFDLEIGQINEEQDEGKVDLNSPQITISPLTLANLNSNR